MKSTKFPDVKCEVTSLNDFATQRFCNISMHFLYPHFLFSKESLHCTIRTVRDLNDFEESVIFKANKKANVNVYVKLNNKKHEIV